MTEIEVWTSKLRKLNPNVTDNHRVRVAREVFTEWGPEAEWLKARDGKPLTLLDGVILRPEKAHLAWHRSNVFQQ